LELAVSYAGGLNGFPRSIPDFNRWITAASKTIPTEAAIQFTSIAEQTKEVVPAWVVQTLRAKASGSNEARRALIKLRMAQPESDQNGV
jgi:hypothetical protein